MKNRILYLVIAVFLAACSAERAPLVASHVVVNKPTPGTQMTAGYFTLRNNSNQLITITEVTSPEFAAVEMHESVLEDGISRMYPLGELTILAGKAVTFEPGGKHLMLMRPVGDIDAATLEFRTGELVALTINVELTD